MHTLKQKLYKDISVIHIVATLLLFIALTSFNAGYAEAKDDPFYYKKQYDIMGIGLPEIDFLARVDDDYIKRNLTIPYGIAKNSVSFADPGMWEALKKPTDQPLIMPSGEVVTMLLMYVGLGGSAVLNTVFADDEHSHYFVGVFEKKGIRLLNKLRSNSYKTRCNLVYVTPGGISTRIIRQSDELIKISQKDVHYHMIKDYKMVIAEAGLWDAGSQSKAILRAYNVAEKVGTKRALLLSDAKYVQQHRADFLKLMDKLDIIIANEHAARELTKAATLEEVIGKLKRYNKVIVITRGEKGAVALDNGSVYYITAEDIPLSKIVDKTGAQAAFASGFLYGYLHGMTIPQAGKLASKVAGYTIQHIGRTPPHIKPFNMHGAVNEKNDSD